jgi:hypothetical protein
LCCQIMNLHIYLNTLHTFIQTHVTCHVCFYCNVNQCKAPMGLIYAPQSRILTAAEQNSCATEQNFTRHGAELYPPCGRILRITEHNFLCHGAEFYSPRSKILPATEQNFTRHGAEFYPPQSRNLHTTEQNFTRHDQKFSRLS